MRIDPDGDRPARAAAAAILALAAGLLVFACIMQAHVAQKVPLWGDELDTIRPAYRVWRGDHSFWWQIGQYNANPPGDNGIERLLFRSGSLAWLHERSPELFWRLPYLCLYLAAAAVAGLGAWAWSGSLLAGFAALAAMLTSPSLFEYGTMVRFYMWLVFFATSLIWLFFLLSEKPRSWLFHAFSLVATVGICFHLMIAGIGYFFLAFAIGFFAYDLFRARGDPFRSCVRLFPRLLSGFLPFIMYKVALKHWVFIPPPWPKISPWSVLWQQGPGRTFLSYISQGSPYGLSLATIWLLLGALVLATLGSALSRRLDRTLQGLFLLFLLIACPTAVAVAALRSGGSTMGRHFIFTAPAVVAALVYLWRVASEELRRRRVLNRRLGLTRPVGAVLIACVLFADTIPRLSAFASQREEGSSERITYPFITWRQAYRALPDRRQLVVVGSEPDDNSWQSDQGEYRAGIMKFYTEEFSPLYYSKTGGFTNEPRRDDRVLAAVNAHTSRYDLLVMDNIGKARELFPRLPWARLSCLTYRPGARLSFCRMSNKD